MTTRFALAKNNTNISDNPYNDQTLKKKMTTQNPKKMPTDVSNGPKSHTSTSQKDSSLRDIRKPTIVLSKVTESKEEPSTTK